MRQLTFPAVLVGGSLATFMAVFHLASPSTAPVGAAARPSRPAMETVDPPPPANPPASEVTARTTTDAGTYYAGCNEVRAAGKAPLYAQQPGYREAMDGDLDGIACEPNSGGDRRVGGRRYRRH